MGGCAAAEHEWHAWVAHVVRGAVRARCAVCVARARRVALSLKDALKVSNVVFESDGRGTTRPLASNDNEVGRALNRRVEVEFWYDDPLQELADEPQVCPDTGDAEWAAHVYDPAWGRIAPLPLTNGEATIAPAFLADLQRALADVAGRTRPRLRFVGYTKPVVCSGLHAECHN